MLMVVKLSNGETYEVEVDHQQYAHAIAEITALGKHDMAHNDSSPDFGVWVVASYPKVNEANALHADGDHEAAAEVENDAH